MVAALHLQKFVAARQLARYIEMNWRKSCVMTLRCTSDLGADDTASALPRNGGGARRRGFDPCVWPIPIREPPLSNRTLKLDKQGSRGVPF